MVGPGEAFRGIGKDSQCGGAAGRLWAVSSGLRIPGPNCDDTPPPARPLQPPAPPWARFLPPPSRISSLLRPLSEKQKKKKRGESPSSSSSPRFLGGGWPRCVVFLFCRPGITKRKKEQNSPGRGPAPVRRAATPRSVALGLRRPGDGRQAPKGQAPNRHRGRRAGGGGPPQTGPPPPGAPPPGCSRDRPRRGARARAAGRSCRLDLQHPRGGGAASGGQPPPPSPLPPPLFPKGPGELQGSAGLHRWPRARGDALERWPGPMAPPRVSAG